uniref:Host cell attachment protein n=5 Tax=Leptospira santarosai TaxID=28183 RepID=M6JQT1_9LEPT|nr:host cell attachment protein [Leptospira santarosai serovar Arenal str. MAVJ 401]
MSLCAPRLLVISLAMDRSSLLCKEPTLSLRGFWLSRSLWIAHLCFAKNQRFRSAAFGYLARYGSLDRKENMKNKWVVVANRSEAKIFEYKGTRKGLELLESMKNPKGRMKNRDLILNSSRRVKAQRVAFDTESVQEPKRKVAESFASQISDVIAQGRKSNRFLSLVLISEPRFLGMLLDKMDRKSQSMIFHKMGKDITATNNREILSHLREILV